MTGEYKPNLGSVDKRNEQFKCISNVDSEMIVKEPSTLVDDIHVESQVCIPVEITTSDKVPKDTDQISPERKEHFDTFVRPSLSEDDDTHGVKDMMEHKSIPSSLEKRDSRTSAEHEDLIQRQIKGDIFDMELDQKEEIVMSESLIQQKISIPGDSSGERKSSVMFELGDDEGLIEEDVNSSPGENIMSLENAKVLANDFVGSLTEKAIKVKAEHDLVKEVATEFIQDLNIKAIETAEQLSPRTMKSEEIAKSTLIESMHQSEISVEISDSDIKVHALDEIKSELQEQCLEGKDFRFINSFHSHYVKEFHDDIETISDEAHSAMTDNYIHEENQSPTSSDKPPTISEPSTQVQENGGMTFSNEDIWADEASSIKHKDITISSVKLRKSDNESNNSSFARSLSSGRHTSSPRTRSEDRHSGTDFDGSGGAILFSGSSSGDNFHTAQDHSPYSTSRSRPSSSDIELMVSAVSGTPCSSTVTTEYETAHSSYDVSGHSNISSSQDYHTAASSLPSKDSLKSSEFSESSGHLASFEISEASETLIDESIEHDGERDALVTPSGAPNDESVIDEDGEPISFKEAEDINEISIGHIMDTRKDTVSPNKVIDIKQLSESRETLNASIITLSSGSEATVLHKGTNQDNEDDRIILPAKKSGDGDLEVKEHTMKVENKQIESISMGKDPVTRVVSFEAGLSTGLDESHENLKGQKSIDSEYGSRPESELKDFESRPHSISESRLSRSSSEDPRPVSQEEMSDPAESTTLKVRDPFVRPITPQPLDTPDKKDNAAFFSEQTAEETEIKFSKHFTQVVEDGSAEFESHEVSIVPEVQILTAVESPDESTKNFLAETSSFPQGPTKMNKEPLSASSSYTGSEDVSQFENQTLISRPLGVKYWPASNELNLEDDGSEPIDKQHLLNSELDECSEMVCEETERELEERRKWLDQQYEIQQEQPIEDNYTYMYNQPLDQIEEEDEDVNYEKDISKLKESLNQSLDFEQIVTNKRQIAIRGEKDDDSSMSSLQEFEKLEQDLTNFGSGSESRGSLGSQDSLDVLGNNSTSGISKGKKKQILNVADDAVSVDSTTSLKDFEHMEEACKEAETIEKKAKEQEDVLSEIEEGHESQYSESDSCETLSEGGNSDDEAGTEAFEQRLFQIDEIIKQAQTNVENFESPMKLSFNESLPLDEILAASKSPEEAKILELSSGGDSDSLEVQLLPECTNVSKPGRESNTMSSSGIMQASIDSLDLKQKVVFPSDTGNLMEISTDSIEGSSRSNNTRSHHKPSDPFDSMTFSTDSIEHGIENLPHTSQGNSHTSNTMTQSVDSLEGESGPSTLDFNIQEAQTVSGSSTRNTAVGLRDPFDLDTYLPPEVSLGSASVMLQSTDSLDSGSNNTHATASMLSSHASITSDTLLTDLESEEVEKLRSETLNYAAKQILDQGAIKLTGDDSDDTLSSMSIGSKNKGAAAATFAASSFQQGPTVFQTTRIVDSTMTTRDAYTTKEDLILSPGVVQTPGSASYCDEKMDTSVEESFEEVDEYGNKRKVIIKRSIEPINIVTSETIRSIDITNTGSPKRPSQDNVSSVPNIISERRTQHGIGYVEKSIFKK